MTGSIRGNEPRPGEPDQGEPGRLLPTGPTAGRGGRADRHWLAWNVAGLLLMPVAVVSGLVVNGAVDAYYHPIVVDGAVLPLLWMVWALGIALPLWLLVWLVPPRRFPRWRRGVLLVALLTVPC